MFIYFMIKSINNLHKFYIFSNVAKLGQYWAVFRIWDYLFSSK